MKSDPIPHPAACACKRCWESLFKPPPATRVTHDAPMGALDSRSVSLRELVDNATVTRAPRYEIGEDWNDD